MRCPTLTELPPPPSDKTGWPWTVETPTAPPVRPDESSWPRISIVTPSYNHGEFIEETIRSILLQGYPDLEYIIIDGGSTDQSSEIIQKYAFWLTFWVSEKDRGQAHAINKGLSRSTGTIFQWINSDDVVLIGAFAAVGGCFNGQAVAANLLIGDTLLNAVPKRNAHLTAAGLLQGRGEISQPGFWTARDKF